MKRFTTLASMAALCLAIVAPMPAMADQKAYVQHQQDCMGLLFSNPTEHATECGGPFSFGPPSSIGGGGYGPGCYTPQSYRSGAGEAQFLTVATCCQIIASAPLPKGTFGGVIMNVDYCNYGDDDNYGDNNT